MDYSLDPTVWAEVFNRVAYNNYTTTKCQLCDTDSDVINMSLYKKAASAFTNYDHLCRACAQSLGFTIMIEGE